MGHARNQRRLEKKKQSAESRQTSLTVLTDKPNLCGGCTACCGAIGVRDLGKPYYCKCEHQTDTGCGIYGHHPDGCKGYQCLYRQGIVPQYEKLRPDNYGIVFSLGYEEGRTEIDIEVYETIPGRLGTFEPEKNKFSLYNGPYQLIVHIWDQINHEMGLIRFVKLYPFNAKIGIPWKIERPYIDEGETQMGQTLAIPDKHDPPIAFFSGPLRVHGL